MKKNSNNSAADEKKKIMILQYLAVSAVTILIFTTEN